MSSFGIEQMQYMMDRAFNANPSSGNWHSLLVNLDSVKEEDWFWVPEGGKRSIFDNVVHVGACKFIYDSHAFGDRSMHWNQEGSFPVVDWTAPREEVVSWLKDGQELLRGHVAAIEDETKLPPMRTDMYGHDREVRWFVNTMIQHDLYHAGELNHIRALSQKNDD